MDPQDSNTTPPLSREPSSLEEAFRGVWERVTRAGELIQQLREQRKALTLQVEQLRSEVQHLQQELAKRDEQLHQIKTDAEAANVLLANGERQALAARAKELLSRIDAYL